MLSVCLMSVLLQLGWAGRAPCAGCGYACDASCNCGRCNLKPGCLSQDQCLGMCDAGHNAKWCGAPPPPPPPAPPVPPPVPAPVWSAAGPELRRDGQPVVLVGIGTTCTEYLVSGIGMRCWVSYDFANPSKLLRLNVSQVYPLIDLLRAVSSSRVAPAVRIPLTASSWLGLPTEASKPNLAKFPQLGAQYRQLVAEMVELFSRYHIVSILDLHWTDDDAKNAPMAGPSALQFWESVAGQFGNNSRVFYELYNEPHQVDNHTWANGDSSHAGMLPMLAAVRKHATSPAIIAGAGGFAYDAESLVWLDRQLELQANVLWNFHPYMGPHQAGDNKKCPHNFEAYVQRVLNATSRPVIITEFGQSCQPTDGAAEQCDGYGDKPIGYDQAILTIAQKHNVSWLPWAWRPTAEGPNPSTCQDINGGTSPPGLSLAHPTNGKGADFRELWAQFAGGAGPSNCPGGSLSACIGLCPSNPPAVFKACVQSCTTRCQ